MAAAEPEAAATETAEAEAEADDDDADRVQPLPSRPQSGRPGSARITGPIDSWSRPASAATTKCSVSGSRPSSGSGSAQGGSSCGSRPVSAAPASYCS